eukprot:9338794-Pyramimonas_sp.AAC.1
MRSYQEEEEEEGEEERGRSCLTACWYSRLEVIHAAKVASSSHQDASRNSSSGLAADRIRGALESNQYPFRANLGRHVREISEKKES